MCLGLAGSQTVLKRGGMEQREAREEKVERRGGDDFKGMKTETHFLALAGTMPGKKRLESPGHGARTELL